MHKLSLTSQKKLDFEKNKMNKKVIQQRNLI